MEDGPGLTWSPGEDVHRVNMPRVILPPMGGAGAHAAGDRHRPPPSLHPAEEGLDPRHPAKDAIASSVAQQVAAELKQVLPALFKEQIEEAYAKYGTCRHCYLQHCSEQDPGTSTLLQSQPIKRTSVHSNATVGSMASSSIASVNEADRAYRDQWKDVKAKRRSTPDPLILEDEDCQLHVRQRRSGHSDSVLEKPPVPHLKRRGSQGDLRSVEDSHTKKLLESQGIHCGSSGIRHKKQRPKTDPDRDEGGNVIAKLANVVPSTPKSNPSTSESENPSDDVDVTDFADPTTPKRHKLFRRTPSLTAWPPTVVSDLSVSTPTEEAREGSQPTVEFTDTPGGQMTQAEAAKLVGETWWGSGTLGRSADARMSCVSSVRQINEDRLFEKKFSERSPACVGQEGPASSTSMVSCSSMMSCQPPLLQASLPIRIINAVLTVSGILPTKSKLGFRCYRVFLLLMLTLAAATAVVHAVTVPELRFWYISSLPCAMGAMLGYVGLQAGYVASLLGPHTQPLLIYAERYDFLQEWSQSSTRHCLAVLLLWLCAVLLRTFGDALVAGRTECMSAVDVPAVLVFAAGSGMFAALTCCLMHIFIVLGIMVDKFCVQFFAYPNFENSVLDWNVLQAMLRRAAGTVDSCFLVMQTTALASLLIIGMEVVYGFDADGGGGAMAGIDACGVGTYTSRLLPLPLMVLNAFAIFFKAAAVSEKCSRVPALINSIMIDRNIDQERQYVVQYITNSAAGFYVKEVRLSMYMALKITYITGVGVFFVITRMLSNE